jgi:flagellar biosynthesis protein FliQ
MPFYQHFLFAAFNTEFTTITPIVAILLIIGLATAIFQSVFHIEDATFSLLPKSFAMIAIAITGGFGALTQFENFARWSISHAASLIHQNWA